MLKLMIIVLTIGTSAAKPNELLEILRSLALENTDAAKTEAPQTNPSSAATSPMHFCPEGWMGNNAHCYLVVSAKKSWEEARQHCQDEGADLLSIDKISHTSPFREFPRFEHITLAVAFNYEKVWITAENFVLAGAGDDYRVCPSATAWCSDVYTWDYDCTEMHPFICKI